MKSYSPCFPAPPLDQAGRGAGQARLLHWLIGGMEMNFSSSLIVPPS